MKKIALAGLAGMLLVSASVNAMSISGQAGKEYTNMVSVLGLKRRLALSGNWTHNDDDGDVAGVGLGLNLPLGPLMATVGGKGVYTNPNYGDEGYAAAVGGGLQWKIGNSFRLFGEYYYSRIRSPAVFKVMKKRMLARVTPLCVQSVLRRVIAT